MKKKLPELDLYKITIRDVIMKLYVTVEIARVDDLDNYIELKEIQRAPARIMQPAWSQYHLLFNLL